MNFLSGLRYRKGAKETACRNELNHFFLTLGSDLGLSSVFLSVLEMV